MSYQACSWAIAQQVVTDPSARHVLVVMANYAGVTGDDVWLSQARIARETGLSIRTVKAKIAVLEASGIITPGDIRLVELKFPRADRRPNIYNLTMLKNGVPNLHPEGFSPERGANDSENGVQNSAERGATFAPYKETNSPKNRKTPIAPADAAAVGAEKYSPAFEALWSCWPSGKGGSKWKGYQRFEKMGLGNKPADERARIVEDVLKRRKRDRAWLAGKIPHVSTYLNGRGWTAPIDDNPEGTANETRSQRSARIDRENVERLRAEHAAAGGGVEYGPDDPL
jgi:hypothetical protein